MSMLSVGDMALSYQLRNQNAQLKQQIGQRTQEVVSGLAADLGTKVNGDFLPLASIDRSLATLNAYDTTAAEAALFAENAQSALGVVHGAGSDVAPLLISSVTNSSSTSQMTVAKDSRQRLEVAISALNVQVAGRYAFAGVATDQKPLADADAIVAALTVATAGTTTPADFVAAVDAWFAAPVGGGGFLDLAYAGSEVPLAPFRIGPESEARATVTAADEPIRNTLKGLAMAAMLAEGVFGNDVAARAEVATAAGTAILGADSALIGLRADIGTVESQIAQAQTRNSAERAALEIARLDVVAVDPYDTATALEALTSQMESLYTLTARISRLSFADYMR